MNEQLKATVATVSAHLSQVSRETADRYEVVAGQLAGRLPADEFTIYSNACMHIADAGWRSFEPVNLLLELGVEIEGAALAPVALFGEKISGYSLEPVTRYFEAVGRLHAGAAMDRLPVMEETGERFRDRLPGATSLLAQFYEQAGNIAVDAGPQSLAWFDLADQVSREGRETAARFLKHCAGSPKHSTAISWPTVQQFSIIHGCESALVYLARAEALYEHLPVHLCARFEELLLRHDGDSIEALADVVLALKEPAHVLDRIFELSGEIADTSVLSAFLEQAADLPLDREGVVRAWLSRGMALTRGNSQAGVAWVRCESLASVRVLSELEGQVNFPEIRRTFDLLAESLAAHPIEIVCLEGAPGDLRELSGLPQTDGRRVMLPESVNLFDDRNDNYGFYKVSLFHQLGYVEFGCFEQIGEVRSSIHALGDARLAERLFLIVEDARIDWRLARAYPGLGPQLAVQKSRAADARKGHELYTSTARWIEAMVQASLDVEPDDGATAIEHELYRLVTSLASADASLKDSVSVMQACYRLMEQESSQSSSMSRADILAALEELPPPIDYRGEIDVEQVQATRRIEAVLEELQDEVSDEMPGGGPEMTAPAGEQDQVEIGELKKGDVEAGVAVLLSELDNLPSLTEEMLEPGNREQLREFIAGIGRRTREASRHRYDEWDYQINDYRAAWCTLFEHSSLEEDIAYVEKTMLEHQDLSRRIRTQLNKVRPEMLRKVKGVTEGEDLELERTIAYMVDRKAGLTPEDNIYVQRQRRDRDVSTLFLLDMSASTDDIVPDPDAPDLEPPDVDDDEYLMQYFEERRRFEAQARRIIDLEKQAVILMADALEALGDAYSVCGFSGYGREQVDYFLAKDFDESFSARARGRIGGIKPARSTRMGPPIRHATRRLVETGSRIKALIIISDGYPQDHDYGTDRNSRDYGLMDTMKALGEAKQQGVLTYCLTVDPSGHDYLRAMCPDSQYMVIQDIEQLPEELSRVYRSLTG